jgi:subtilisin family serine protease
MLLLTFLTSPLLKGDRKKYIYHFAISLFFIALSTTLTFSQIAGKESKYIAAENSIVGQYIVVLAREKTFLESQSLIESRSLALAGAYNAVVENIFLRSFSGFTARMSKTAALELSADKRIAYVEEDSAIQPSSQSLIQAQSSVDWGLDRIDQRSRPIDSKYVYSSTGAGVNVYILDSGINPFHQDFGGRASVAHDVLADGQNGIDCTGHGTHVAGTIGSSTYGVAKSANLRAVRVLPCTGTGRLSDLILGIEWVTANRIAPAVVNISSNQVGTSPSLDSAINNSIAAGVHYVVSAGNQNADACRYAPANIANAIVAGATTGTDNRAGYSNQGACIDVWAPGHNIRSLDHLTNDGTATRSGTSQAAPMVAGTIARYLENNPAATPATVQSLIKSSATSDIVTNIDAASTRSLLHTWLGSERAPTPGRVRIIKRIRTRTGGTASPVEFTFAATELGRSSFVLIDNDTSPLDTFENPSVYRFETPGAITVTEVPVSGWRTHAIGCIETPGTGSSNRQNTTVDLRNRRANIVVEQGEQVTCTFEGEEITPTAANVSIGGRIGMGEGRSVARVAVVLTNPSSGQSWVTHTNTFGYYQFPGVPAGVFYIVSIAPTKRYIFLPDSRSLVATEDMTGIDFFGRDARIGE